MDAFLVDRQSRGLSSGTIVFYRKKLALWRRLFRSMDVTNVEDIMPHHLRQGLVELAETHNPGGVHAAFRTIRAFLKWYEEETEPEDWRNPIGRVRAPKVPTEPLEPIPLPDLKAMLGTCDKSFTGTRDRAILLSLLDTGCRASEFVGVNLGDVNRAVGTVLVRRAKGGKFRAVFLGAKARRQVMRYLRYRSVNGDTDPLWVTVEGKRLTYGGLRHIVERRAKRAGVKMPGLHSFRRGFALACLRNGVDLISLQRLMGHSDLSVLQRYLAQVEGDLQAAHAKGGPVDHLL